MNSEEIEIYEKLDLAVAALKAIAKFPTGAIAEGAKRPVTVTMGDAVVIAEQALELIFPKKDL